MDIAKFLVKSGADVNLDTLYGNRGSAIRIAAKNKQYEMVDYLLSVGADISAGGEHRGSTLTSAVMTGKMDLVKKVVAGGKANLDFKESLMRSNDGKTALMIAATRDFSDIVQFLGAQGAKINVARSCGETAVYYAAKRGSTRVVQYLLSKGAVVNPETPENCNDPSPILVATGMEVHRLLLQAGANPNVDPKSVDYWARPTRPGGAGMRAQAGRFADQPQGDLRRAAQAGICAELQEIAALSFDRPRFLNSTPIRRRLARRSYMAVFRPGEFMVTKGEQKKNLRIGTKPVHSGCRNTFGCTAPCCIAKAPVE